MTEFNFKGRFTLREINGDYNLYDRELNSIRNSKEFKVYSTFTKAKEELIRYKILAGDVV